MPESGARHDSYAQEFEVLVAICYEARYTSLQFLGVSDYILSAVGRPLRLEEASPLLSFEIVSTHDLSSYTP